MIYDVQVLDGLSYIYLRLEQKAMTSDIREIYRNIPMK
jgi:hypothetical protein